MTQRLYGTMQYRVYGDNYNHLMAQVSEGGQLFVEMELEGHIPAGGELPLMEAARPVSDIYDYRRIIASGRYVYWFAYPADIVSQWKESQRRPEPKYARVLTQARDGYPGLVFELNPGETLWAEYYWLSWLDCLSSTLVREPIRGVNDYDAFMAEYSERDGSVTFWALTHEQEKWYEHRKAHNYYSPFQEDPELTRRRKSSTKAPRHAAPVSLTKAHAETPPADQPTKTSLWLRFAYWAAGYPCP